MRLAPANDLSGEDKKALQYLSEVENHDILRALFNLNTFSGYDNSCLI